MQTEPNTNNIVEAITRTEYDVQIATAKKYPRSIKQFMNTAMEMVTLNIKVADECIYALPRGDKTIEGPSARFAEIIIGAWGHSRSGARVVSEDNRFITAQGICHDLQNNNLITIEVQRRITDKKKNKFNDDMVGVTGNAAISIALRNAILKTVPKAFWSPIYDEARKVVMGDAKTLVNRRSDALTYLQKFGATPEMVIKKLGVKGVEDITLEHLVTLRGYCNAIKEGEFTVERIFSDKQPEEKKRNLADDANQALNNQEEIPVVSNIETTETITKEPEPDKLKEAIAQTQEAKPIADSARKRMEEIRDKILATKNVEELRAFIGDNEVNINMMPGELSQQLYDAIAMQKEILGIAPADDLFGG